MTLGRCPYSKVCTRGIYVPQSAWYNDETRLARCRIPILPSRSLYLSLGFSCSLFFSLPLAISLPHPPPPPPSPSCLSCHCFQVSRGRRQIVPIFAAHLLCNINPECINKLTTRSFCAPPNTFLLGAAISSVGLCVLVYLVIYDSGPFLSIFCSRGTPSRVNE